MPPATRVSKSGNAVWRCHGARVALLRWAVGHDGNDIILKPAGGLKR